jgi:hypothetical protein
MEVKKLYKLEVDEELRVEVDCPKNEKVHFLCFSPTKE